MYAQALVRAGQLAAADQVFAHLARLAPEAEFGLRILHAQVLQQSVSGTFFVHFGLGVRTEAREQGDVPSLSLRIAVFLVPGCLQCATAFSIRQSW